MRSGLTQQVVRPNVIGMDRAVNTGYSKHIPTWRLKIRHYGLSQDVALIATGHIIPAKMGKKSGIVNHAMLVHIGLSRPPLNQAYVIIAHQASIRMTSVGIEQTRSVTYVRPGNIQNWARPSARLVTLAKQVVQGVVHV